MQLTTHLQTFTGADADQRFARDDAGDDIILRDREMHDMIMPQQDGGDDEEETNTPPPAQDEDMGDDR